MIFVSSKITMLYIPMIHQLKNGLFVGIYTYSFSNTQAATNDYTAAALRNFRKPKVCSN